jgi:archaellum component FlaC
MTDDRADTAPPNVFDTLLMPLRLPARVASDIETLTRHAGTLVSGLRELQETVDRIEVRVADLESMEETITERLDGLRTDLNVRMRAVENEVKSMRPPMDSMAEDVGKIDGLLPDPSDGPLTRLKDTFTSSG